MNVLNPNTTGAVGDSAPSPANEFCARIRSLRQCILEVVQPVISDRMVVVIYRLDVEPVECATAIKNGFSNILKAKWGHSRFPE